MAFLIGLLLLLQALLPPICRAYTGSDMSNVNWRFFQASDGMPESWTRFVTVSPTGRLWLTHGGVAEVSWMDGWPDSMGNLVHRIPNPGTYLKVREDQNGQLWSIYSNGIQVFRNDQWRQYETEPLTTISWFESLVPQTPFLPAGPNEIIYLLQDKICLFSVLSQNLSTVRKAGQAGLGQFIDLSSARRGGFWVSGERGVARFYINEETGQISWREHIPEFKYLRKFHSIIETSDGELYLAAIDTRDGQSKLVRYDFSDWQILSGHTGSVVKGWPGENGYWVMKPDRSLSFVSNDGGERIIKDGILSAHVFDVAVDTNDIFFLATSHGVARYTPSLWRVPDGTIDFTEPIHAIHEDSLGRIWFGSNNYILKLEDGVWTQYRIPRGKVLESFRSRAISSLKDGRIVIDVAQMDAEILLFNPDSETFDFIPYRPDDAGLGQEMESRIIFEVIPRRDGTMWVRTGTVDGTQEESRLEVYDGELFTTVMDEGAIAGSRDIIETVNGDIFIGTASGRILIHYSKGDYRFYDETDGFTANGVFFLHENEDGTVWAAGREQILEFDGAKWSTVKAGLDIIYSISGDLGKNVWVASGTGVHRYVDSLWITYTVDDGLPNSAALSVLRDSKGNVWAGTTRGLALFNPDADHDPPETFISERDNLTQVPSHGEVRLIFSGVDKWHHTRSGHLLFSHRLDGGPWSNFRGGSLVDYKGLDYGSHRFEVRAMDLNMNLDTEPAAFDFMVLLPWYRERGFLTILAFGSTIILVLLGVAIHRHFLLEKLVIERTSELQTANVSLMQNQDELEYLLENERLLARVASLLNCPDSFFELTAELMEVIGSSMGLDISSLVVKRGPGQTGETVDAWASAAYSAEHEINRPDCVGEICSLCEHMADAGSHFAPGLAGIGEENYRFLQRHAIGSFACIPLTLSTNEAAFIFLARMEPHQWKSQEQELFSTIADMIANSWQRHIHFQARLDAEKKQSEAVQMAEKASRMASIGVMAGGITHEINQPLNALKLNSKQVLLWIERSRDMLSEKVVEKLKRVPEYVNRIDEIVKHMREFWISPDQKVDETFDLNESVRHALTLIKRQINTRNTQFNLAVETEEMLIKGSRISVELIVINLAGNAVQALNNLQQQEKVIDISVRSSGKKAVVEVSDNGKAMFAGEEEEIFDPFYSTKKPSQGIGLGLAIVKRLTEELHGHVQASVNSRGGATFIVEIPLVEQP